MLSANQEGLVIIIACGAPAGANTQAGERAYFNIVPSRLFGSTHGIYQRFSFLLTRATPTPAVLGLIITPCVGLLRVARRCSDTLSCVNVRLKAALLEYPAGPRRH